MQTTLVPAFGFTQADDWFVVPTTCHGDDCTWEATLARIDPPADHRVDGVATSARASGDGEVLFVASAHPNRYGLYALSLDGLAGGEAPALLAPDTRPFVGLVPRPGGRELLVARAAGLVAECLPDESSCGEARYSLFDDTLEEKPLVDIRGPQWAPDGVGILGERAGTLVYVPMADPRAVYELGAAEESTIFVPPTWPPAERPR